MKQEIKNGKMKYVVVDIGCIECGEQSAVLGIFTNKKQAEEVQKKYREIQSNNWTGQHYFEIFEIKEENVEIYNPETYLKHLKW